MQFIHQPLAFYQRRQIAVIAGVQWNLDLIQLRVQASFFGFMGALKLLAYLRLARLMALPIRLRPIPVVMDCHRSSDANYGLMAHRLAVPLWGLMQH